MLLKPLFTLIFNISYYLKLVAQDSHRRKNKSLNYNFYELTYFKKNASDLRGS